MIDWSLLKTLTPSLLSGAVFSVLFTVAICVIGGVLALCIAFIMFYGGRKVRYPTAGASLVIRGFPLLVLLYLIYYGFGTLNVVRNSPLWIAFSSPMFCALLAFSINHAFFVAQILTGALNSLPKGMVEASTSLGLGRLATFAKVQFPLAFRLCLPAYRNEVILYFKSSSLVTVVTLTDLLSVAKSAVDENFDPITPFFGAACLYWVIVQVIQIAFDWLDRRIREPQ